MMPTDDSANTSPSLEDLARTATAKADHGALECKGGDWEIKALDDSGVFSIYMAAFGNVDRGGDVIEPGAFKNLDEYARSGWIGINHTMDDLPIAYPISATQDAKGLLIRGKFHSTPEAQSCRTVVKERMAAGKAVTGSIGYKVDPQGSTQDYVDGKSVRRIKSLSIYESSFVNLPMNPHAEALSAKSMEGLHVDEKVMTIDSLKTWMDAQTKSGKSLSKSNHTALKGMQKSLDDTSKAMKSFLDVNDPENPNKPDEPDDDDGDKDAVNQRRTAGNAIPADQNPRGAETADSMGKSLREFRLQKEEQLAVLRARVLRDQFRFARS